MLVIGAVMIMAALAISGRESQRERDEERQQTCISLILSVGSKNETVSANLCEELRLLYRETSCG